MNLWGVTFSGAIDFNTALLCLSNITAFLAAMLARGAWNKSDANGAKLDIAHTQLATNTAATVANTAATVAIAASVNGKLDRVLEKTPVSGAQ